MTDQPKVPPLWLPFSLPLPRETVDQLRAEAAERRIDPRTYARAKLAAQVRPLWGPALTAAQTICLN